MSFVERRDGVICGVYACRQPGRAEEELPDDNPEVVAYLDPPLPSPPRDPIAEIDALKAALFGKRVIAEADVAAAAATLDVAEVTARP